MNYCFECKKWSIMIGKDCHVCGNIVLHEGMPKLYSKNYWLWIKANFYE